MNKFNNKSIEEIGYYVYALTDPRDEKIFYIGKGCGNRVFQHCKDAIQEDDDTLKLNHIREIIASGAEVGHYILRHKLTEEEAYQIESVLIDFLTYPKFNTEHILTNIVQGYHQWDEGIKTVDEINAIYGCDKIKVNPNDNLLLVSLNKSFDDAKSKGIYRRTDIYEKTRKYWAIAKYRASQIDYVLGVYHGIVRAVLKVEGYKWTLHDEENKVHFKKERCSFQGRLITDSSYLNKDISDFPFGHGGATRYI
ncbi:MAG: LEM-3-like GIY-YIG domain-containing protein [Paludibacteraceae bacterium]